MSEEVTGIIATEQMIEKAGFPGVRVIVLGTIMMLGIEYLLYKSWMKYLETLSEMVSKETH